MPYTQKGKKAKRTKKITKKKKQKGGDTGIKVTGQSIKCPTDSNLVNLLKTKETKETGDTNDGIEVDYTKEKGITIKPFLSEPPFTNTLEELKSENIEEIPEKQKKIFLNSVTEISEEIGKAVKTNKPIIDKLTLNITDTPKFIDSHLFSNVENLVVQLNDAKPLEIETPLEIKTPLERKKETSELIRPPPPETIIKFNALFPNKKKKLSGEIKLEDTETLAILGAHLPFNFFDAVFSSNTLKTVTFKHKGFTAQTEEKKINGIEFIFAN